jgi:hypothetical protein
MRPWWATIISFYFFCGPVGGGGDAHALRLLRGGRLAVDRMCAFAITIVPCCYHHLENNLLSLVVAIIS